MKNRKQNVIWQNSEMKYIKYLNYRNKVQLKITQNRSYMGEHSKGHTPEMGKVIKLKLRVKED